MAALIQWKDLTEAPEGLKEKHIWDICKQHTDDDGRHKWCCPWCSCTFSGWNATKAEHHLAKKTGKSTVAIR